MSDLVGNSEDQFSCVAAQLVPISFIDCKSTNSQIQKLAYNSEIEKSQNESHLCLFVCYVYLFALILNNPVNKFSVKSGLKSYLFVC